MFKYEYIPEQEDVRKHIQDCEGNGYGYGDVYGNGYGYSNGNGGIL